VASEDDMTLVLEALWDIRVDVRRIAEDVTGDGGEAGEEETDS
jgi:hypothetical protein